MSSQGLLIYGTGRMGQLLLRLIEGDSTSQFHLVGSANRHTSDVQLSEFLSRTDIVIDFSLPDGLSRLLNRFTEGANVLPKLVSGTTGLSATLHQQLRNLSQSTSVLHASNFSLGVNLLIKIVKLAAQTLSVEKGYDASIIDVHHRRKVDHPSGTAVSLAEALIGLGGRVNWVEGVVDHPNPEQATDSVTIQALRGGGIVGDHHVSFTSFGEQVTLSHRAIDRSVFAHGAYTAAKWIANQPPGYYSMSDLLNIP